MTTVKVSALRQAYTALLGTCAVLLPVFESHGQLHNYRFYTFEPPKTYTDDWSISALNDAGWMVGAAGDGLGESVSTLWINGFPTTFGYDYEGIVLGGANAVAEDGTIASGGFRFFQRSNGFVVRDDLLIEMEVPEVCEENEGLLGMNRAGTLAVGSCCPVIGGDYYPVIYDALTGEATVIPFPPGSPEGTLGWAYAVNNDGIAVGILNYPGQWQRGSFVWNGIEAIEIINPLGGLDIGLFDINNKGIAAGSADDESYTDSVVTYDITTGAFTVVGDGTGICINERGHIAGLNNFDDATHTVLYKDGEAIDLNPFFPEGWRNPVPDDINNYGWITGIASPEGNDPSTPWLLVPVYSKGDYDGDSDVDLHDFGHFQRCFAAEPYQGPEGGLHVGCSVFDFDDDVDLDLTDFDAFQAAFTGAITSGW